MKRKLLVVDDDAEHRRFLKSLLEKEDFSVSIAEGGLEAVKTVSQTRPDLILSDVAMPGMSGVTLCRRLKADPRTSGIPIVLMSGEKKAPIEQAAGIEEGADDYVLKPFTPRLLLARIRAVLRRFNAPGELEATLVAEGLVLDVQKRTVTLRGRLVALTRKEFDLLTTLLRQADRVVSVKSLLEQVWGYDTDDYDDPHTVESHVYSLRRKLGSTLSRQIVTVTGIGYRFDKS